MIGTNTLGIVTMMQQAQGVRNWTVFRFPQDVMGLYVTLVYGEAPVALPSNTTSPQPARRAEHGMDWAVPVQKSLKAFEERSRHLMRHFTRARAMRRRTAFVEWAREGRAATRTGSANLRFSHGDLQGSSGEGRADGFNIVVARTLYVTRS